MIRRQWLSTVGLVSFATFSFACQVGEPEVREPDPWVGKYFKYARFDTQRTGQLGEVQTITITKNRDGYTLGKPYADRRFREVRKGVLSDGQGGLGTIYLGSAEFADGVKVPVLRAEFCYEWFVLYRADTHSQEKPSAPAGK